MKTLVNNKKIRVFGLIALLLIAVIVVLAFKEKSSAAEVKKAEDPIQVNVLTVSEQTAPDEVWAVGTVSALQSAMISPKIMSTVTEVLVKEGDRVVKGQVIARLESKDLRAQVTSAESAAKSAQSMSDKANVGVELQSAQTQANIANAEANLQMAKEQLALVMEGPRKQEKAQAELAVVQAEAQFKNAQIELDRMTRLYNEGVIPKQRLDIVQTQYDVAKAQLDIAKKQVEIAVEGSRSQDIESAKERVKQAEAGLRLAKAAMVQNKMAKSEAQASDSMVNQAKSAVNSAKTMASYSVITAPFSGRVTARFVDPGAMVSPGVPIVTIEDDSLYRLEATLALKDMESINTGMKVGLEIGNQKLSGEGFVSVVSPAGDPSTRKFLIKVDVPSSLSPSSGDFGRAGFAVGYSKGIFVPETAIIDNGGIDVVFVVGANNQADMRIVRIGRKTRFGVEIITGLTPGDKVVTWSSIPLTDDAPIKF